MLYSMTGFGRAERTVAGRAISVEIKTLNGKGFEMGNNKLPPSLKPHEIEIRALLSKSIVRGTADVTISVKGESAARPLAINMDAAEAHYRGIEALAARLELPKGDVLATLLRMPDVLTAEPEAVAPEDFGAVKEILAEAVQGLFAHRAAEGASLEGDLSARIAAIEGAVQHILPLEEGRGARVRERLASALKDFGGESRDPNRFEQELIYYMEKSDISEEKTRLAQHLSYFREVMQNGELSKGKVLGFILQEIGREINTLGSKAGDAAIQKIVVGMKDELEKAKEQVLNVL